MFLRKRNDFAGSSAENNAENLLMIKKEIQDSDAVILGAGAGLSATAGFTYSGERFEQYTGHTGAVTYISTGIWIHPSRYMTGFISWSKIRTILC